MTSCMYTPYLFLGTFFMIFFPSLYCFFMKSSATVINYAEENVSESWLYGLKAVSSSEKKTP